MACKRCGNPCEAVLRPKDGSRMCKPCFLDVFEEEVHEIIISSEMFDRGNKVGVGVSGGKDSTVLAFVLDILNKKYDYGVEIVLLSVDEGIEGYRDRSMETVIKNGGELGLKLEIVSFSNVFGVTMDEVVKKIGRRRNCMYCGIFRRQALEEAARRAGVNCIVTGHNADDIAETVLLNIIRGDISRLRRCTLAKTRLQHKEGEKTLSFSRLKPFKNMYQKEIVLYAFHKKLDYFSTECIYSPGASRGDVRMLVKELEKEYPATIANIVRTGDMFLSDESLPSSVYPCALCNNPTSSKDGVCGGCTLSKSLGMK